jgi:GTP-binding protein
VVEFSNHNRFTVADIPGLAIGAAENVGLGHSFLRHIERSRVLLFLVDASSESGAIPPCEALDALRAELHAYNPELSTRPALVAATKLDLGRGAEREFARLMRHSDMPTLGLSSVSGRGVKAVTATLLKMVLKLRADHERERPPESIDDFLFDGGHTPTRKR